MHRRGQHVRNIHIWLCLLIGFAYALLPAAVAQSGRPELPRPEILPVAKARVLHFSTDRSIGRVTIHVGHPGIPTGPGKQYRAQGDIPVPANAVTRLEVNSDFFRHLDAFKTLDPYSLDALMLRLSSTDDAEEGLLDEALAHIGHLKGLQAVFLDRSDASDKGLAHLKSLTNLHFIEASSCLTKGAALKEISTLTELKTIRLGSNAIDQENLKYLSALPKLDQLALTRTGLSAKGLKYVANCPKLIVLQIGRNGDIGDDEMKYLVPLKKLAILHLNDTAVTMKGLATLKHLRLVEFLPPRGSYSADDLKRLHQWFPLARIELSREDNADWHKMDPKNLFKPISKDKGL
ncbi:MAG: hypothetical protein JSS83_02605 [Cyanobacteria bacterium SZAS LIN-3]|nr:hypothetical protein [Cyanobacteria bacterium SZAS LIN-3]